MASSFLLGNKSFNLDDFLQLQALLDYEQQERDRHIAACRRKQEYHPPHHHYPYAVPLYHQRSIDPEAEQQSVMEKQRLDQALLRLRYLKDQYRRQRNAEIQDYLEAYRRQALIRAVQQEEEERYYRQCIAAALEQQRVNALWQQYLRVKQEEVLRQKLEQQHILAQQQREQDESEEEDEYDEGYSKYRTRQLEELLRHVFGNHPEYMEEEKKENSKPMRDEDKQDLAMDEVWKYLSDQKLDSETPRTAFLSSEQDKILQPSNDTVDNRSREEKEEEEEDLSEEEDTDKQESSAATSSASTPPPTVQDHVVGLQELIQKLASEPVLVNEQLLGHLDRAPPPQKLYNDEPKPSGIWATSEPSSEPMPHDEKEPKQEEEEPKQQKSYLPKHIFTEAEPTPTRESLPSTPVEKEANMMIQEADEENKKTQEESDFVDSVAAEQKGAQVDSQKASKLEALDAIAKQLTDDKSELLQRWNNVLKSQLSFTKQPEGTLMVTASSDANRKFLGSEDELTRLLLKLDAIQSEGDDEIREKRRSLVKKCEQMLDTLDRMKHNQWQAAFKKQEKKRKNNRRRKHKKNKHKK
ncbi:uncharacterized protein B0P05DRAFT_559353 [Gilbertella persicaria]|uniref:uncharacterized protein n=1 Tax=Gilbertella persicaria TaxID=101096 RepID=UPI0022207A3A|nr:uncharacterized protein B0P05DRAFT_559353 [Gilbertella persicaria]KAI8058654.1 hypothetical protein B0P05DRAFT_559353 [Gilbertella persicaria]